MLVTRFIGQDDAFGVESVSDGVQGGGFSAGIGFGSVRFCAVGTGGVDFSLGGHFLGKHGSTDLILGGGVAVDGGRVRYLVENEGDRGLWGL